MDCEVCGTAFHSKRDLRNHLAKTDHRRMRYVCVWCVGKHPREFKSDWDLRRHIRAHHPHERDHTLKEFPRLLSSENSFYFSTNPTVHLLTNPTPNPSHPEAIEARRLVTKWAAGRIPGITRWIEGWNSLTSSSSTSSVSTPPINNPELILKSVTMDSTGCTIICCSNATYIKAKVPLSALTDARLVSRLVRRMNALPKEVFIPSGHWELGNPSHHTSITSLLGLQPNQIESVVVLHLPTFTSRKSPDLAATASSHSSPSLSTQAFVPVALPSVTPAAVSTLSFIPDAATSPTTDVLFPKSTSDMHIVQTPESTPVPKHLIIDEHPTQLDFDYNDLRSPTPVSISSPQRTENLETSDQQPTSAVLPSYSSSPFYNPVSPTPVSHGNTSSTPNYEPAEVPTQTQSSKNKSAFRIPPVYIPTPRHSSVKEVLKTKAHSLLLEGRLPLLPPARREWNDVPVNSIKITPTISWPPAEWTCWAPDQKTLYYEFVAMTLHAHTTPLPRSLLRARYNFLALPGSLDLQNDALAATMKQNFNLVRLIALNEDPTTPDVQMSVLSAFDALPRDSSLDDLLARLKDVPLRLKKQRKN
ncbi:hypothetical protein DPMN_174105 [Dreissena polymorpha]|uniref:C2H2-type domain-containing protein n=1 Tax=Dreissena polymorpha TaxID=45954 RepID=A0A9D4IGT4_DREPO|nr:hypothetical protein DPMN_174105 [Dreissena polymorpha]